MSSFKAVGDEYWVTDENGNNLEYSEEFDKCMWEIDKLVKKIQSEINIYESYNKRDPAFLISMLDKMKEPIHNINMETIYYESLRKFGFRK